jgi:hypothetical protein
MPHVRGAARHRPRCTCETEGKRRGGRPRQAADAIPRTCQPGKPKLYAFRAKATRSSQGTLSGDQLGGEHSELACAQAETRDTKTSKRTRVPCLASPAPQHHSQPVPQARPHARHFCTCPCAALHLREQGGAAERDAAKARSLIPLLPALRSVVRVRLSHQGHRRCTLGGKGFVCVYRVCTECRAKRFCEACVSFCSLLSVGVVATSVNMSSFFWVHAHDLQCCRFFVYIL